ncbi:MAG: VWA domain-containing protein [Candidatus Altiarchaeales archaeon]|nr:VWA domain-containing protein [Candidatus Altiarchaeota archaeon]MCG2782584.1 VWA domain-containing protein [Candidatus Altiarchaeales archaeon]
MQDLVKIKQQNVLERIRKRSANIDVAGLVRGIGSVYILLDCSGSMMVEGKITQAKKGAMNFVVEAQGKGYSVGLIQFGSSAIHVCEPQREISVLEKCLNTIKASGSTNMTDAILLALQKLKGRKGYRVMVIVTDGMPDSQGAAVEAARQAKANGIDILTIGTDDADRDFLAKLASKTELSVKVTRDKLEQGITSMAKMLPDKGGDIDV